MRCYFGFRWDRRHIALEALAGAQEQAGAALAGPAQRTRESCRETSWERVGGWGWMPAQANHPEMAFCEKVPSEDIAVMLSSTGQPEEFRRTTITVTNPEMSIAISATNRVHFRTCDRAIHLWAGWEASAGRAGSAMARRFLSQRCSAVHRAADHR